jgi:hypothetical protein
VRYVELWAKQLDREYTPNQVEIIKIEFWGMKAGDGGEKVQVGIAKFIPGQFPGSKTVDKIHVFEDSEVSPFLEKLTIRELSWTK